MVCAEARKRAAALAAGDLDQAERSALEEHLRQCPTCAAEAEGDVEAALLVRSLAPIALPEGVRNRVRAGLRPSSAAAPAPRRSLPWTVLAPVAAAAALLLLGALALRGPQRPPPSIASPTIEAAGPVTVAGRPAGAGPLALDAGASPAVAVGAGGTVEVRYPGGAEVRAPGPARFEVHPRMAFLTEGQLTVFVAAGVTPFQVVTPQVTVTATGAGFAVLLDDAGGAEVRVEQGSPRIETRRSAEALRPGDRVAVAPDGSHRLLPAGQ